MSSHTILVVDNEPQLVELYTTFLDAEYDVRPATTGEAALEKLDRDVAVVVLDRRMPHMSGDEVLAEIRHRQIECQVALITAVSPKLGIVDLAFDAYLHKPVSRADLCGVVADLLTQAQYPPRRQEYCRLWVKYRALDTSGYENTEAYQRLVDRLAALETDLSTTSDSVCSKALFQH